MKKRKYHSLSTRFILLLLISGIISIAFFFGMQCISDAVIESRFSDQDYVKKATEKHVNSFQEYVNQHSLSATDTDKITQWMKQEPLSMMEIYRSNNLLYSSYAPDGYDYSEIDTDTPYYDWIEHYVIVFSDGQADVLLSYDFSFSYSTYATIAEVVLSSLLFLLLFIIGSKRTVNYIRCLCGEIQTMEGGDLSSPVTVKGVDDLTVLAESLDAMRIAFCDQQEQTARAFANNQQLISEMSHDLRTPLTTLKIYTEILRYHKYDSEEQMNAYLEKIDDKASQIKQLSENLLEYSLITKEQNIELEEPAPVQKVFEEPIYDMIACLAQYGYHCSFDGHFPITRISVHSPFIHRIMDNITSNILKYAALKKPVIIMTEDDGQQINISFKNEVDIKTRTSDSNNIGITVIRSMMKKMNGSVSVKSQQDEFCIILHFPKSDHTEKQSTDHYKVLAVKAKE